jgi:hypothetical protein
MSAGLSDGFVYAPKPPAAPAANIRVSVPPYNKDTYNNKSGSETVMFNIPCGRRGQYLNPRMSYLKFNVNVKTKFGDTTVNKPLLALDGGAHAFFQTLEVYHGSNMLEQIREYNTLYQLLIDNGETASNMSYGRSVADGVARDKDYYPSTALFYQAAEVRAKGGNESGGIIKALNPARSRIEENTVRPTRDREGKIVSEFWIRDRRLLDLDWNMTKSDASTPTPIGDALTTGDAAATVNGKPIMVDAIEIDDLPFQGAEGAYSSSSNGITHTFCIPLVSGIIGAQMPKYLPTGAMATDLRVELTLAKYENAFRALGFLNKTETAFKTDFDSITKEKSLMDGVSITLDGMELMLEYIEVASDVQMAIESATGAGYIMSFDSFANFSNSIKSDPGTVTQLIGARFSSVKTAYTMFRDQHAMGNLASSAITSRLNPFSRKPNRSAYHTESGVVAYPSKWDAGVGWDYLIGATHYPPKPVATDEETYYEAVKASHSVAAAEMTGILSANNWSVSARRDTSSSSGDTTAPSVRGQYPLQGGTFFISQNFESQSHKSHLAESGLNTLAQTMYVECRFPGAVQVGSNSLKVSAVTSESYVYAKQLADRDGTNKASYAGATKTNWLQCNAALQMDHFIHYDGLLLVENGICNTRF